MTVREFAVPVVLGLIVAAGFWAWDPPPPDLSRSGDAQARIDTPYVLEPAPGTADHDSVLLRYNATPRHALGGILDLHAGTLRNGTWTWSGADMECLSGGDCTPQGSYRFELPPGEQNGVFGVDGLAANVTFYLFANSGHLLATNAPLSQWEVYDIHGDFTAFSAKAWWFGPGQAPAGTSDVPAYKAELRGLLDGTPAGGVQSAVLEKHAYDWLLGPVWLTVRIDGLA